MPSPASAVEPGSGKKLNISSMSDLQPEEENTPLSVLEEANEEDDHSNDELVSPEPKPRHKPNQDSATIFQSAEKLRESQPDTPIPTITHESQLMNGAEDVKKVIKHKKTPSIQEKEQFMAPEVTEFGDQSGGELSHPGNSE